MGSHRRGKRDGGSGLNAIDMGIVMPDVSRALPLLFYFWCVGTGPEI